MIAANVTIDDLLAALDAINTRYDGNLVFRYWPVATGRRLRFTITVENPKGPGGRHGVKAACWHAHGDLFDAILARCPDAVIDSAGRKITVDGGNWVDWNVGSRVAPMMYSETCDCGKG